jgi:circadian clock protein KaiC
MEQKVMERIKTGILGLDDMLNGGYLNQSANLVEGAPGTGKSTLGMQYIYNGITQFNQPGLILTFEEFAQQYYDDAANFGWDFRALEKAGKLRVIMTSPEVSYADLGNVDGRIEAMIKEIGAQRILVDSLSHFDRLSDDPIERRGILYGFINSLKREGLTSLLTRESNALIGELENPEEDVAFVADSFVMLRYVEIESAVRKALLVLKQRGSNHAKDIRQYEITHQGMEVQAKFEGREGIMSGSPRRMADSFVEAFVRRGN